MASRIFETTIQLCLAVAFLFLSQSGASAAEVPAPRGHVNDHAAILDTRQRADLEERLTAYEKETTHQIVVLTVSSLNGEPIEAFSLRVAKAWRLGRKGFGNGVLLTVAPRERKVRIELGDRMSRYVSDAQAASIVADMLVAFRAGDLGGGVSTGVTELMKACRAYKTPKRPIVASGDLLRRPLEVGI